MRVPGLVRAICFGLRARKSLRSLLNAFRCRTYSCIARYLFACHCDIIGPKFSVCAVCKSTVYPFSAKERAMARDTPDDAEKLLKSFRLANYGSRLPSPFPRINIACF